MIPRELDGAKVIMYLENRESNNFGFVRYEDHDEIITGIAITKYENDHWYYVFDCDLNWNVIGDTLHYSMDEAIECVKNSYNIKEKELIWKRPNMSLNEEF